MRDETFDRCTRAFHRYCRANGFLPDQPSSGHFLTDAKGRELYVLENVRGVLAYYTVTDRRVTRTEDCFLSEEETAEALEMSVEDLRALEAPPAYTMHKGQRVYQAAEVDAWQHPVSGEAA